MQKVVISKPVLLFATLFSVCLTGGCTRSNGTTLSLNTLHTDEQIYPVVVIGGGVGGLTAALYTLQAQVPTLLLEGSKPGGALAQSHSVRNWPGVQDAPGTNIIASIKNQVLVAGARITTERVTSVDFTQWPRVIKTVSTQDPSITHTIQALSVIIATGTEPNLLGIPGEQELWGKGVSNCAVCDGSLFKNKRVIVVGGGDAAITEAAYLADIAQEVVIVVRKDNFKAKDTKQRDVVLARSNVRVLFNTELKEINGDETGVTKVVFKDNRTHATDGVFLAIGSQPNTALFKQQLTLDTQGFITLAKHQECSVPGVFAVGDVCDSEFVQAITAAGDGCKAALQAISFLKGVGYKSPTLSPVPAKATLDMPPVAAKGEVHEILTTNDIDRFITKNKLPVVLDVFATWCGPCQQMAPIIDRLAKKYAGKVAFVKLNIENTSGAFEATLNRLQTRGVQSVPSFLLIRNGKEVKRLVGGMRMESFETAINNTFGLA